jgi:ABC-type branched-subunit amino acid transport system ATPase component
MTEPVDFSVPEELLRVSPERPRAHRATVVNSVESMARGLGLVTAGCVMIIAAGSGVLAVLLLLVAVTAIVVGRTVVRVTPSPRRRQAVVAIVGSPIAGVGAGLLAVSAIDEAKGKGAVAVVGALAGVAGAALLVIAYRAAAARPVASVAPALPTTAALEIRGLDFAYGTQQVLFDVSLTVEEGEIAALLGTNGAGKSTILRAVAGLDPPISGSIRLFGGDTTYVDAEELTHRGISLLAGGRMTFPSLTVEENLRVGAYSLPTRSSFADVYDRFPQLATRRQQRAGTLSGGEQQMLALGRVLLTAPKLLLIDELTLGLAPKVVEELIGIVREVNAHGTTVLLVEQSANLALALAAHSFFLERGEVRFDGPTEELLQRDDLLRPVFLTDSKT